MIFARREKFHADRGFESLRDEMREMRVELREFRGEMQTEFRADVSAQQRQITAAGWGIAAALLAQLVAFVLTQS